MSKKLVFIWYRLVLGTLRDLEDDRKCWRLVNGVLVQKSNAELKPDIEIQIHNMREAVKVLEQKTARIKEEMDKLEKK